MFLGISTRSAGMGSNFELLRSTSVQVTSRKAGAVFFFAGEVCVKKKARESAHSTGCITCT
jgi:hypothetical protein